jgi:hypothetical protein
MKQPRVPILGLVAQARWWSSIKENGWHRIEEPGRSRKTLEDPAVKKRIEEIGSIVLGNSPQQFAEQIGVEVESHRAVVKTQGLID